MKSAETGHGIHIVLLEPEIPQNTGNIARTCVAFNIPLHLIHPLGFSLDEKAVRRAGLDYWRDLELYEYASLNEFHEIHDRKFCYYLSTKSPNYLGAAEFETPAFLVFGKESAGIPEDILRKNESRCFRIPMKKESRSLNLSNAVNIAAYELLRQKSFPGLQLTGNYHHSD